MDTLELERQGGCFLGRQLSMQLTMIMLRFLRNTSSDEFRVPSFRYQLRHHWEKSRYTTSVPPSTVWDRRIAGWIAIVRSFASSVRALN